MRLSGMTRSVCTLVLALYASGDLQAISADVCHGPAFAPGADHVVTNATVFVCPKSGKRTIPQLANAGWQLVKLSPIYANNAIADRLLLRSTDALFRGDFE